MKNFLIKVILVLITGSLAGGSLFYFWKNKYVFSKDQPAIEEVLSGRSKNMDIEKAKAEDDKKIFDQRAAIINYVEKNINKISSEKPASGLVWRSVKIWFIDDNDFYVDYMDELLNTRRLLISQSFDGPAAEYEVLGFFVPGENGWVLKTGKDIGGTTSLKLYEKNEENNEWVEK